MRRKQKDTEAWEQGMYNLSAFSVALSKALQGRKSHAEYMKEPLYEKLKVDAEEENLTESQKEIARKNLLMSLHIMQANFEMNHESGGNK